MENSWIRFLPTPVPASVALAFWVPLSLHVQSAEGAVQVTFNPAVRSSAEVCVESGASWVLVESGGGLTELGGLSAEPDGLRDLSQMLDFSLDSLLDGRERDAEYLAAISAIAEEVGEISLTKGVALSEDELEGLAEVEDDFSV